MLHVSTLLSVFLLFFFFFNDTATTEIYTLSLHDALPICLDARLREQRQLLRLEGGRRRPAPFTALRVGFDQPALRDRKSTRLNSSHGYISYAVFCLKKKKQPELDILHAALHPATRNGARH